MRQVPTEQKREWKPVKNFVPIMGKWEISAEEAKATFTKYDSKPWMIGIAISSIRAVKGDFRAKVSFTNVADGCAHFVFGHDSATSEGLAVGLGGYDRAYSVSRYSTRGSRALVLVGRKDNLQEKHEYRIEATLRGQLLVFRVDEVEVLRCRLPPLPGNQFGIKGYGEGEVIFKDVEVRVDRPRAFVVMPFSEPYNSLWEEVIRPVAEEAHFDAHRADDVFRPGLVLQDIEQSIVESQIVIAEVSSLNANVFYEIGYARALGKPTIFLAEQSAEGAKLPFDISGFRCVFYEDAIRGKSKIEGTLREYLRNLSEDIGPEEED